MVGFFLFNLSSNKAQAAYLGLEPNSDLSIAGPYDIAVSGTANWGNQSGRTSIDILSIGHKYRIRQNGNISAVRLYTANKTGLSGFYVNIYRLSGSTYTLIGQSDNLVSQLVAGSFSTVTLASPITGVQEGDYYGMRIESIPESATFNFFARTGQSGVSSSYISDLAGSPITSTWAGTGYISVNGAVMPVELYMQSSQTVFIGDSIISGHPSNLSFLHTTETTNIASTIERQFSNLTGYIYQNMGIGAQTTSQIAARFTNDVVNLHPRVVVIEGGVNDIAGGSITKATFLSNWTMMLNACRDNNIIPMVIPIMPWTNGTTNQMNTRDDWNASLVALAETYEDAIVVDVSSGVGQFRAGGPEGNLWNIQSAYNADGVHFNSSGHGVIATALASALEEYTDHLTITGNASQVAGVTQTLTLRAINNFGDVHTAYTGDKTITLAGANTVGIYAPTFTDKNGSEISFGSSGAITFTNGIATTNIKLYKAETAEIDATDSTYSTTDNTAYDLNVTVSPNSLNSFSIVSLSNITSEAPFNLSLTAKDIYGNTTNSVTGNTVLSVSDGSINLSSITDTEFQDDGIYTDNITISEIYNDKDIVLSISNGSVISTKSLTVDGVSHGIGFISPPKPNISSANIITSEKGETTLQNIPSNVYQIAISRTPDFEDVSWQDFNADKFKTIGQASETLYIKFRTRQGAVSDVITYTADNPSNEFQAISDGDIVKTVNNPDVYVIKIKNNKKYKRLILSPSVFKSYGHLKWSNIKIISQTELNQYVTSSLVKETKDSTIYELIPNGDTGTKQIYATYINGIPHLVRDDTLDGNAMQNVLDSVYEINAADRDSYKLVK